MKKLFFLCVLLGLSSCAVNKYHGSDVEADEISKLAYFEPISYIHFIIKGNTGQYSDSLSTAVKSKLDSLLLVHRAKFRLSDPISVDTMTQNRIAHEASYLANEIFNRRYIDKIQLTPTIDSVLESRKQRFGLIVVATGFGRVKGNYTDEVVKGAAVGIFTLGLYVPIPNKSSFMLHAFIMDSERNEIAFYRKSVDTQKNPTDKAEIEKQVLLLFEDYFYDDK